jgi:hypothetical protein
MILAKIQDADYEKFQKSPVARWAWQPGGFGRGNYFMRRAARARLTSRVILR